MNLSQDHHRNIGYCAKSTRWGMLYRHMSLFFLSLAFLFHGSKIFTRYALFLGNIYPFITNTFTGTKRPFPQHREKLFLKKKLHSFFAGANKYYVSQQTIDGDLFIV
jgi:hypothetical protein